MRPKIGIVVSSTRPTRVGRTIADWVLQNVQNHEADFEIIDLKEINLPFLSEKKSPSTGEYEQETTKKWSELIQGFDGFIFVTAEYNNGPPAPLKNAIDSIFHEWDKKPVAFVGYGTYGATRAVEQLVNITAKVGMVPLPKTFVGITKSWDAVKEDGSIDTSYMMGDLDKLTDNVIWWANLTKNAQK